MGEPVPSRHRRRERRRSGIPAGAPAPEPAPAPAPALPEAPPGNRPEAPAGPPAEAPGGQPAETTAGPPAGTTAGAPAEAKRKPRTRRTDAERGLRGIVGAGPSQVGVLGAMRARDAARPTEEDLAAAERDMVIIRRHYVAPDTLPGGRQV